MSLKEWKQIYYPTPAITFHKLDSSDIKTISAALSHSLQKWKGIKPEIIAQYGLEGRHQRLLDHEDRSRLEIDATSCALCHLFNDDCSTCPLRDCAKEYGEYCDSGDPIPMITLIESRIQYLDYMYETFPTTKFE